MTADDIETIFRPFTVNGLTLKNRIVMAPMGRAMSPDGLPTPEAAAYYRRRAENDVGLILTEGALIDHPVSSGRRDNPNFYGAALEGWQRIVDEVHAGDGKVVVQLWHVGISRDTMGGKIWHPDMPSVSPSGLADTGRQVGAPMTHDQIAEVIDAFTRGARIAQRMGFDGVEIHGAHGYLIDQFFWDVLNKRTDAYGGDIEGRARFAAEIIAAVRRECGPRYPVFFRFSQWKIQDYTAKIARTPDELARLLKVLTDAGTDLFHCSTRRFGDSEFPGSDLSLAGWTKKLSGKPAMAVGSVGLTLDVTASGNPKHTRVGGLTSEAVVDFSNLTARLALEEFDLIAVGRALIADPYWAKKLREGRFNEFVAYSPASCDVLF
jgi:2,4-dienoyl-CoA reductase-like NADH-dependent reductase (Old Yellow Enzyme family)